MASNLPTYLSMAQVRALRDEMDLMVDKFARSNGVDARRVRHEMGFVAANYAANAGVLNGAYKEWLDAHRSADAPAEGDAQGGGEFGDGFDGRIKNRGG